MLLVPPSRLRAILFDVDGTLYWQEPVRRGMLARLLRLSLRAPLCGYRTLRALRAYRQAQERLRVRGSAGQPLAEAQVHAAACQTGYDVGWIHQAVAEWMERTPLDLVAAAVCPGLREFLNVALERNWKLAVVSDYPAAAKLKALGVDSYFTVQVCAQDAAVQCFKPDPRGLFVALERLGVVPEAALYVGDRPEVDGVAAARAGIACAILRHQPGPGQSWQGVAHYQELQDVLCG